MKTSELKGTALDWAVAKCEGQDAVLDNGEVCSFKTVNFEEYKFVWQPSTNWSQGGVIIEREVCDLYQGGEWYARIQLNDVPEYVEAYGDTPLIAAMRCYVASKLGDEVEIPVELTQGETQ